MTSTSKYFSGQLTVTMLTCSLGLITLYILTPFYENLLVPSETVTRALEGGHEEMVTMNISFIEQRTGRHSYVLKKLS